jgi:hypothetical protein
VFLESMATMQSECQLMNHFPLREVVHEDSSAEEGVLSGQQLAQHKRQNAAMLVIIDFNRRINTQ